MYTRALDICTLIEDKDTMHTLTHTHIHSTHGHYTDTHTLTHNHTYTHSHRLTHRRTCTHTRTHTHTGTHYYIDTYIHAHT